MSRLTALCLCLLFLAPAMAQLDDLSLVRDRTSARSSSWNRDGGNQDCLWSIEPGKAYTLMEAEGPGKVTHLWFTYSALPGHETALRDLVLRMYWEGSQVPCVEVPFGDFFAQGHARHAPFSSAPVVVGDNERALNCYWPMPFKRHARVTLENRGERTVRMVYYHIEYELGPIDKDEGLFHAAFVRSVRQPQEMEGNLSGEGNWVMLETTGQGQYVGTALFVDAPRGAGWWGEGDEMIWVDGELSVRGTGTEDYFNNAWGFGREYSFPYYGATQMLRFPDGASQTTVYRWHVPDPIRFRKSLRVTLETGFEGKPIEYAAVCYWYQRRPVTQREPLPDANTLHPAVHEEAKALPEQRTLHASELETELRARAVAHHVVGRAKADGFRSGAYLAAVSRGKPVELRLPVPHDGRYQVGTKLVDELIDGAVTVHVGGRTVKIERRKVAQLDMRVVDLGVAEAKEGHVSLTVEDTGEVGIEVFTLAPAP